ncbi:decarboxylating cobalt-precorrin-6B (C(15))-methyltransferase [Companilactobacillus sp.]|jgi:cobalt-precorrin-6B (C15)-methyltransferase|uniref:decarboxylating cobalt-precorrin-6B (C(15))-methyltransferase n=1 Tax=Companilactobacillus sp. TaxID=2767905 RepID=UPI0025C6DAD9|nr:decarboxylating cobalt-precorrin-6B (C(15))-methyltransferase [Companilactobacillus sp.]MCH4008625.1 decarboxylating cobalt-precorrin-6B (C(15))-methyltransferase [Companilactobacillus sp.]MCH4051196.1 decarboxylating cobalt-precorrin-6B (C(15))-methyltransferase [Companilactobacillus sp.]MCH4076568.1 decarboxylating cobalt-precorrin-6B (C(15))-methyltransferase [Companilactobacillus sp.]MCH4125143.1 decarboxylating cobalt-precorrin-6B (C(15))-methyltransferase [Companilactobacillus sp.]MCH
MKDDLFIRTKVPMTKSEVRSISLDKLQLQAKNSFLDIGSGTGSVSMQAALEFPELKIVALEKNPDAIEINQTNIKHFGINNIDLQVGTAPEDLPDEKFDSIFVGGSGGELSQIIDYSYQHLTDKGMLVLNFILNENALEAIDYLEHSDFTDLDVIQVAVSKWHQLGKGHYFKPQNPTIIISAQKGEQE